MNSCKSKGHCISYASFLSDSLKEGATPNWCLNRHLCFLPERFAKKTYELQIWSLFFVIHRKIVIDPHKLYMVRKGRFAALKCILVCQNWLRIEATGAI